MSRIHSACVWSACARGPSTLHDPTLFIFSLLTLYIGTETGGSWIVDRGLFIVYICPSQHLHIFVVSVLLSVMGNQL